MKQKGVEVMEEGRLCKKCGMPLSIYNPNNTCFCHQFPKEQGVHGPDSLCTSGVSGNAARATQAAYHGGFVE